MHKIITTILSNIIKQNRQQTNATNLTQQITKKIQIYTQKQKNKYYNNRRINCLTKILPNNLTYIYYILLYK